LPISREGFEKGEPIVALEEAILKLLSADRQVAYNSSEIASLFHQSTEKAQVALDSLLVKGAILGRIAGDFRQAYYAAP